MSDLKTPALVGLAVLVLGGGLLLGKSAQAERAVQDLEGRKKDLEDRRAGVAKLEAETAELRSRSGTKEAIEAERRALLGRALARKDLNAALERLRAAAKRCAEGPFDSLAAVKVSAPGERSPLLARIEVQVDLTTDWPRLGVLLGEVRALAPRLALEEATMRRAEAVPYVGVRLTLVAYLSEMGGPLEASAAPDDPLEGPSPFFLASELDSGRSRRVAAPWAPPRVEVSGIIYSKGASRVIVNDEPVAEGASFHVGAESVKVVSVEATSARFRSGDVEFERALAPLSGGGK